MHAVAHIPRWSLALAALVAAMAGGRLIAEWRELIGPPTHGYRCDHSLTTAESRAYADDLYRDHRFESAECVLRVAAEREEPAIREQLHVIASFYHQLGHSFALGFDGPYRDQLMHLDWAIQYDAMLGGAHGEELSVAKHRALTAVGPE
jgi:hypothetical protein